MCEQSFGSFGIQIGAWLVGWLVGVGVFCVCVFFFYFSGDRISRTYTVSLNTFQSSQFCMFCHFVTVTVC